MLINNVIIFDRIKDSNHGLQTPLFIMVTRQSDKFQCIIPRVLTAYNFFKASLSGNKSIVAGR